MADSGNSTSAPCANPHPFDPNDWLDRFKAVGGWWITTSEAKASIGWGLHGFTHEQNLDARKIFAELDHHQARRIAVRDLILAQAGEMHHG